MYHAYYCGTVQTAYTHDHGYAHNQQSQPETLQDDKIESGAQAPPLPLQLNIPMPERTEVNLK